MSEFEDFGKISRLSRECVITEKIDGTNAQVYVDDELNVKAGSRNRWITPEDDNYGFARWVKDNEDELRELGPGRHFGEWWGAGIQRRYDLKEKRFSLFNTARWIENYPSCCHVVPVLYHGVFDTNEIDSVLETLRKYGSVASPNFMNPEGIVIWHTAARVMFKKTLDNDALPKSIANNR